MNENQQIECQDARKMVTSSTSSRYNEAFAHVQHCPLCLARFDQLARAIISESDDEISCAECRVHMSSYYELQQGNVDYLHNSATIQHHLATCPYCAYEYAVLNDTMVWAEQEWDEALELRPDIPLPFLSESKLWILQSVDSIRRLAEAIVIQIREQSALFDESSAQWVQQQTVLPVTRAEADESLQLLHLPDIDAGINVQISIGPAKKRAATLLLSVYEENGKPIEALRIILRDSDLDPVMGTETDSEGSAIFSDLAVGRYLFELRNQDQRWEIPINIQPTSS